MDNNFQKLKGLVATGKNCVMLGRTIEAFHFELYEWIMTQTEFLNDKPNISINERIYCIINGINAIQNDAFGEIAAFDNIFKGYALKQNTFDRHQKKLEKNEKKKLRRMQVDYEKQQRQSQTPLEINVIRNKKRNAHLYSGDMVEGYDYVVCPVSKQRLVMIKSNYIEKYLNMTVEEFDKKFPNTQKIANSRPENISRGLTEICPETGLTRHATAHAKAQETLRSVGEDGKSGYKKLGEKTKSTHMANVDERGRNGYQRQAYGRVTTMLPNGLTVEQNAHIKMKETLMLNGKTGSGGASKLSIKKLKPILDFLTENDISYYFDETEYGIRDPETANHYFYDLTIAKFKIAIEFQSNAWHSNPAWADEKWDKWCPPKGNKKTASEALTYDYNKARVLYRQRGIVTHYVWEDSADADVKDILCLLKTMTTKF